jgi:Reverse transcriptase (RNA-dependent DNA polymerase)
MKLAKNFIIIIIFKGGNPTESNNYRPISILPILSKVLEKIVYKRLTNFLQNHYQFFQNSMDLGMARIQFVHFLI